MNENTLPIALITISIVGGYLAQAAFTPAIIISVSMIFAGLTCLLKKRYFLAGALLIINSLSIYWFSLMM
jgi:hypothetical protein